MAADPKPGSDEAIEAGCTCPVMDNAHGRGFQYGGQTSYWTADDCPLHAAKALTPIREKEGA